MADSSLCLASFRKWLSERIDEVEGKAELASGEGFTFEKGRAEAFYDALVRLEELERGE